MYTRKRSSQTPQGSSSMSRGSPSPGDMPLGSSRGCRPTSHRSISTKVLLAEGTDTPFTEHCRKYENTYHSLRTEIQKLKDQVQDLHRDLTKPHSLINTDRTGEILERSQLIDSQITSQYSAVLTLRSRFEELWEETFQNVTNEQEIYEAQLHDLLQLKQENSYLTTIARQTGPYILSIAKVKERLEPRFQEPKDVEDNRTEIMLKIYRDSSMTTESQHSDTESSSAESDWEPGLDKRSLTLRPNEPSLQSSDYCWPDKQRGMPEIPNCQGLPL